LITRTSPPKVTQQGKKLLKHYLQVKSLEADFKSEVVRKSENYESNYLNGKYNAIPYLRHFNRYFEDDCKENDT